MRPEDVSITEINGVFTMQSYDSITETYTPIPWDDQLAREVEQLHEQRERERMQSMIDMQREFEEENGS